MSADLCATAQSLTVASPVLALGHGADGATDTSGVQSAQGAAKLTGVHLRTEDIAAAEVEYCGTCGAAIALRPPTPSASACAWLCTTCGSVYFGGDSQDDDESPLGLVRAPLGRPLVADPRLSLEACENSAPPENMQRLIKALTQSPFPGSERRRAKHYYVTVPVVAVPLGLDFCIIGEPVQMTTLNVSLTGASLIHTRHTDVPYYALDFNLDGIDLVQVVMEVLRVRSIGVLHEVAGRFVSRLSPKMQEPGPASY